MSAEAGVNAARAMLERDVASRELGIEVQAAGEGGAVARMRVGPGMLNGHGIAHGGYLFFLADTAFALACNSRGPATVARAAEIVFMRPAHEGDELVATASERAFAGRSGVYDVTVTGAGGEVVAEFRGQSARYGSGAPEASG